MEQDPDRETDCREIEAVSTIEECCLAGTDSGRVDLCRDWIESPRGTSAVDKLSLEDLLDLGTIGVGSQLAWCRLRTRGGDGNDLEGT